MAESEARGRARMGGEVGAGWPRAKRGDGHAWAEPAAAAGAEAVGRRTLRRQTRAQRTRTVGAGTADTGGQGGGGGHREAGWRGHSGPPGLLQNREATEW
jgi:hypothetical protein